MFFIKNFLFLYFIKEIIFNNKKNILFFIFIFGRKLINNKK